MGAISKTLANAAPLIGAVVRNLVAGYSGSVLDCVYFDTDGQCLASDADAAATGIGWGIVVSTHDGETSFVDGDGISVVVLGPIAGFYGMAEGSFGFISGTAGQLDNSAGTVTWRMGYALESTIFFVLPGVGAPTSA
jgi:hypothetical protein